MELQGFVDVFTYFRFHPAASLCNERYVFDSPLIGKLEKQRASVGPNGFGTELFQVG